MPAAEPAHDVEDFDNAAIGSVPPGWVIAAGAKKVTFAAANDGAGMVLQIAAAAWGSAWIKHSIDVAPYRGKRVEITARGSGRPGNYRGFALVGVNVDRPGARGYGDRVRTERIETPVWQDYQAFVDVARDATGLALVVESTGPATSMVDDIRLRVIGDAGAGDEPPRELAGRGLDNIVAFARLYGIVRYFHPSDEVAALDEAAWNRFVIRGVREVESARDAATLAARLEALFAPIAPAVVIQRDGEPLPAPAVVERPVVHWSHLGLGISKDSRYQSTRTADEDYPVMTITTEIDPALVRGKEIQVTLRGRGRFSGDGADAGLWIAERKADGSQGFYTEPEKQPPLGPHWTTLSVHGKISDDAASLGLGVQVIDDAEVWLEPPVVTADGKPVALAGWGKPGPDLAPAWTRNSIGFTNAVGAPGCDKARPCLHARATPRSLPDRRPWVGPLGGGAAAWVPLELSTRDGKTIPAASAALPVADAAPLVATDRATRLTDVIIAWNIFEHFYPYFDVVATDWMAELPRRLSEAAVDDGPAALHATLRRLAHDLHDGHAWIFHPSEDQSGSAPWLWEQVEGQLVITQVDGTCACDLRPGDVVTSIDGAPTAQAIAAEDELATAATEQYLRDKVLRRLRSGPEGSRRRLTVERNGAAHGVELALIPSSMALEEKRPDSGDEVAPGIRYVNLDKATEEQWNKILPDLAKAKAVIYDMRGYPNFNLTVPLMHATRTPLRNAQLLYPIPARPDREDMTFREWGWTLRPAEPYLAHVVFLTDGRAVSAAETFMGIAEAYKLGPIVGSPTAGTNGNIDPFYLPGGYFMWWTGMKVLKQDGSRHHGVGILPTVLAARTLAGVAEGRDEVLDKGIEVAQQLARGAPNNTRGSTPARAAALPPSK